MQNEQLWMANTGVSTQQGKSKRFREKNLGGMGEEGGGRDFLYNN